MNRTLKAGTKLPLVNGRVIVLAEDAQVVDDWRNDDHFAGSVYNMDESNLALYAEDLADCEQTELVDGVLCHRTYTRVYGAQAIKELTLVDSTPIAEELGLKTYETGPGGLPLVKNTHTGEMVETDGTVPFDGIKALVPSEQDAKKAKELAIIEEEKAAKIAKEAKEKAEAERLAAKAKADEKDAKAKAAHAAHAVSTKTAPALEGTKPPVPPLEGTKPPVPPLAGTKPLPPPLNESKVTKGKLAGVLNKLHKKAS